MYFLQHSIMTYESRIITFSLFVTSLILNLFADMHLWLMSIFFFVIGLLFYFADNETIHINENGISCFTKRKILWTFNWNEIEELRKSKRQFYPTLEIVLKSEMMYIAPKKKRVSGYYFQLGRKAKHAVELYCSSLLV